MRLRPKSDYMHTASYESLYALTEHWQSDIQFYQDEMRFLNDLISKYFIWLIREDNVESVRGMAVKIVQLETRFDDLTDRVTEHLGKLELLIENPFVHDEQVFRNEHAALEDDLEDLINEFKVLKKGIFTITEYVIDNERLHHLLAT